MCLSLLGQVLYGAIMIVTLALTATSMFTPGWRKFENETMSQVQEIEHMKFPHQFGILPFFCHVPSDKSVTLVSSTAKPDVDFCKHWWENLQLWEKVVVATMSLALIAEVIAVIWTFATFCMCCCKTLCLRLLPLLALIVAVFLALAIGFFASNNYSSLKFLDNLTHISEQLKQNMKTDVGYSFYLSCGALLGALVDILVGSLSLFLAKHCC